VNCAGLCVLFYERISDPDHGEPTSADSSSATTLSLFDIGSQFSSDKHSYGLASNNDYDDHDDGDADSGEHR
jgi:hypothetical protein